MKKLILKFKNYYTQNKVFILAGLSLIILSFVLGNISQPVVKIKTKTPTQVEKKESGPDLVKLQEEVLPEKGFVFKINWANLGKRLVDDGVIDEKKLAQALTGQETLPPQFKQYLDGSDRNQIEVNAENAQFWVDVLWGLGLANKNEILEKGPMVEGGNTANYASTGGYTIGEREPMQLYDKFSYINLTPEQQSRVAEIAGGVYRPCCGNSTAFPDCNHGMAALALIELMVSQNIPTADIYKTVLVFNSYWFPQTYLDIAYHFAKAGRDFKDVSPAEILSKTFSSAQGYQALKRQIGPVDWPALQKSRGGCGA